MNLLIAILSTIIALFFVYNFNELMNKIQSGKLVNKHSVLATSALIFHFLSISLHFFLDLEMIVLISQAYMLGCLIYLFKKK